MIQPVVVRALGPGTTVTDVDGDGVPEFVDPSGTGSGLTGRVATGPGTFAKPILIGPDALSDVSIRVLERTDRSLHLTWGVAPGALQHDLYEGALVDLRDPVLSAARTVLACGLPPGPGDFPLAAPGAGNRYYLMASVGPIAVVYGVDSFGTERAATVAGCR